MVMHKYEGRTIEIHTRKVEAGWEWAYTIDGGSYKENTDDLAPTEEMAEQEALAHAKSVILSTQ
jgi:hypothetical protein